MHNILKNWNFFRFIRLLMGILIIFQAFTVKDFFLGIAGLLFTSMTLFNIGCCGAGSCYSGKTKTENNTKDIEYEEVA